MSGLANDALADVPIEFWTSKFEVKKSRLVWRRRPRESFQTEAQWRSWNKRLAGKPAGAADRHGKMYLSVPAPGLGKVSVSAEKVVIVLETGTWPGRHHTHHGKPWANNIGTSPLGRLIECEARNSGLSLDDLTVLSKGRDPFRLDTPAYHEIGYWVAERFARLVGGRAIHLRGFHYVLVSAGNVIKPDGRLYENSHADWLWLSSIAMKAARWLDYIDTSQLVDKRNAPPVIFRPAYEREPQRPHGYIGSSLGVSTPSDSITPPSFYSSSIKRPSRYDDVRVFPLLTFPEDTPQRYCFAIFGEKSSLDPVVRPFAQRFGVDMFLGTGELSDIYLEQMAGDAAADGRMLIVFTIADFDPSGLQMSVSIGRKLQGYKHKKFPDLEFQVVPVMLTAEQVAQYDLPETPLKAKEKRASRWRERFGREQTEIDALAALRPEVFEEILSEAIKPYWDSTIDRRRTAAKTEWYRAASRVIASRMASVDADELARIRADTDAALEAFEADADEIEAAIDDTEAEIEAAIDSINEHLQNFERRQQAFQERRNELQIELNRLVGEIPTPDPPERLEAEVDEDAQRPLIDSRWGFAAGSRALKARKAYEGEEPGGEGGESEE
jgi:F0F1-type ATP synthase membrane subunit b/b'